MPLKQRITRQYLKDTIGEYNIFAYYFGSDFVINKGYNSVLRDDDHKSTSFFVTENGTLLYNDFALSKKYDFVQFVMEKFGVKYYAALELIDAALNSGATGNKVTKNKPSIRLKKPKKRQIIINVQAFKKQHIDYWQQFKITPEELKLNDVYAITTFSADDFTIPLTNELRFAFLIKDYDKQGELVYHTKIYTPYSQDYKWISYCPLNVMFGYVDLPFESDTLFISKSQKERLVVKKLFTDVVSLQSENKGSIDPAKMAILKSKYKRIIYFGDNDNPGLTFCDYVKTTYGIETYTFPTKLLTKLNIKDIGDFVHLWDVDNLAAYFKQIKIL